jgi:hypothetical protein
VLKLIKVIVLSNTALRRRFVPSLYAGRNQIPYSTAPGESETDGGSARNAGRSEIHTFRFGSIGNENDSYQAFSTLRDIDSYQSCDPGRSHKACCSGCC